MTNPEVFMFPGQGCQYPGMGKGLLLSTAAQEVFTEADEALDVFEWWDIPVRELCLIGPAERLNDTVYAQPAILTVSVASWKDLVSSGREAAATVGHSLGEYAALVAANSMEFKDAVMVVAERGRLMKRAAEIRPGGMVAIVGLALSIVEQLCARLEQETPGSNVQAANRNSPGQIIISGDEAALSNAADYATELGARMALRLPVTIAGHSKLMISVVADMTHVLDSVSFANPSVPFYSPTTGGRVDSTNAIRALLIDQLTSGVDWVGTIEHMISDGYRNYLEVGPKKALSRFVREINPDVEVSATNS